MQATLEKAVKEAKRKIGIKEREIQNIQAGAKWIERNMLQYNIFICFTSVPSSTSCSKQRTYRLHR